MSGDVTAAIERSKKRLRTWSERIGMSGSEVDTRADDTWEVLNAVDAAEAEVERLRAEREALHSDETREKVRALISRQARALGDGSITPGVLATLVMNLLSAGSEADQ